MEMCFKLHKIIIYNASSISYNNNSSLWQTQIIKNKTYLVFVVQLQIIPNFD